MIKVPFFLFMRCFYAEMDLESVTEAEAEWKRW